MKKRLLLIASYNRSILLFRKDMLLEFMQHGYEVLAVAPDDHPEVTHELKTLGIGYQPIKLSRTGFNPFSDIVFLLELYKVIKAFVPSVIIPYTVKPVVYGGLAARRFRNVKIFPIITGLGYLETEGGGRAKHVVKKIILRLYKTGLKKVAGIFFQNKDDAAYFSHHRLIQSNTPMKIISGSGVNMDHFRKVSSVSSPVRFLLVARLLKSKGVQLYVEAAALLKKKHPYAEFHLIGQFDDDNPDGIDKEWLMRCVKNGYIIFHGFKNDIREILAASSVFVLPSYYREGIPRTILEAMAMGKPVITTNNTGCRETVNDNLNGFLIPVRKLEPLINAMERFIIEPVLIEKMGNESHSLAQSKFDVHIVNNEIVNFIKANL